MIIMVSLAQCNERHPPTVPTGIGPAVGLASPQVADRIDAECGVQHEKDPPGTGQHEAAQTTDPAVVGVADEKRQRHSRQEEGHIPTVLPPHDRIFPKPWRISFGLKRALHEEPDTVAVPEPFHRIVGIFFLVHARVVPGMIGTPFQRRVLHRPAARDQKRHLDRVWAPEAAMRNHPVIPYGNAQAADEIQNPCQGPVPLRTAMDVSEERHPDEARRCDQSKQSYRPDIPRSPAIHCTRIQVIAHSRTLVTVEQGADGVLAGIG